MSLGRVNQQQVVAGFDVIVKTTKFAVFAVYSVKSADPGAEQGCHNDQEKIDHAGCFRTEWLQKHHCACGGNTGNET